MSRALLFFGNKILAAQRSEKMKLPLKWNFQAEKWRRMKIMKNALLGN
jgi:hypothetical protein